MGLTVGQLRKAIEGMPDDRMVIISKDARGNRFSPLEEMDVALYDEETRYSGWHYKMVEPGFEPPYEEVAPPGCSVALFLWPVI